MLSLPSRTLQNQTCDTVGKQLSDPFLPSAESAQVKDLLLPSSKQRRSMRVLHLCPDEKRSHTHRKWELQNAGRHAPS